MNLLVPALGIGAAYLIYSKGDKKNGAETYTEQEKEDMIAAGCYDDPPGSGSFI